MKKTTIRIDGMMCGMCETHIKDAIRKAVPEAKKVTASHKKGEAAFLSDREVEESVLKRAIEDTGYHFLRADVENHKKKGLFGF